VTVSGMVYTPPHGGSKVGLATGVSATAATVTGGVGDCHRRNVKQTKRDTPKNARSLASNAEPAS
jgi:hypothetical protein